MAAPPLVIEFRSRGWSGSAETVGPWRAIECMALGAGWARGSTQYRGLLGFPEAGDTSIKFHDPDRDLDPFNSAGAYYGQIDVGADLRLTFATRQVFIGRITGIEHDLSPPPDALISTISAQSFQGKLALISALALQADWIVPFPDEITATRVNRILDACEVPSADRDVEAGGQMINNMDHSDAVVAGSAWDVLVRTMEAELGSIEITTAGKLRTRNRNTVWNTTPAATLHLGCCAHAGVIPIYDAQFETLRDTVRNVVQITVAPEDVYGPVSDAASKAKYGLRKYDVGIGEAIIHFDGGTTWVNYFLPRMKSPLRSWRVTLRPQTQAEVDAIELVPLYTSRVHVYIDDAGGAVIDLQLRPVGVEWSVDPDGMVAVMILGG